MTDNVQPPHERSFHEIHASLLDNLANYQRYAGTHAGKSYARSLAGDVQDLLSSMNLREGLARTGTLTERTARAIEDASVAFWAVVAAHFPEVLYGDLDPLTVFSLDQAQMQAVNAWLLFNHPDNVDPAEG